MILFLGAGTHEHIFLLFKTVENAKYKAVFKVHLPNIPPNNVLRYKIPVKCLDTPSHSLEWESVTKPLTGAVEESANKFRSNQDFDRT